MHVGGISVIHNAILQCRDMYLRPEYYAEKENTVRALISDLINAVEIGATGLQNRRKTSLYKNISNGRADI